MLRADLMAARIPVENEFGVVDFHALRHSFISSLARAGVHPKIAQDLARHSSVELTMRNYTHTRLESRVEALEKLPGYISHMEVEAARKTGTDAMSTTLKNVDRSADSCGSDNMGKLATDCRQIRKE